MRIANRKKPRSKKAPVSAGPAPVPVVMGSEDETARLLDDTGSGWAGGGTGLGGHQTVEGEDAEEVGQKRKRYITVVDQAGKKRKMVDVVRGSQSSYMCAVLMKHNSFHADIQLRLRGSRR